MICPTCERETSAVTELGEAGAPMRKRCAHPDCKAALPKEAPAQQARPATSVSNVDPIVAELAPSPRPAPANGAPPSFAQILAQFEARLPYVRERIAELRAYEAEERQLVAALGAAGRATKTPENKPS
jgi:hypothetical protein